MTERDPHATARLRPLEDRLHALLTEQLENDLSSSDDGQLDDRGGLITLCERLLNDETVVLTEAERQAILGAVVDRVIGLGPLEPLLRDPEITEIMVNGPSQVFIERGGRIELAPLTFRDEAEVRQLIDRMVAPLGRRIDESSPMVDARLPDGSRGQRRHPAPGHRRGGSDYSQIRVNAFHT